MHFESQESIYKKKMSSSTSMAAASTLDRLSLYLGTCTKLWIGVYLTCCLILSIRCFMFHVTFIGLFLCVLSYFRLPAAEPSEAFKILGRDPLNLDGSPSRSTSRGVLGLIGKRFRNSNKINQ